MTDKESNSLILLSPEEGMSVLMVATVSSVKSALTNLAVKSVR